MAVRSITFALEDPAVFLAQRVGKSAWHGEPLLLASRGPVKESTLDGKIYCITTVQRQRVAVRIALM